MLKKILAGLLALLILAAAGIAWHLHGKRPQREGTLQLPGLAAAVDVRYDEWGVPHISAQNEPDLYRALGYLHAQDRLFQMEMLRRLARGELAAVLGEKLVDTDRLMRTLGLRAYADRYAAAQLKADTPANRALAAYLDGINHYQATRPAPLEFEILGIPKRPFTQADTAAVGAYLAYSFAAALRTEPVLTQVRDQLGAAYLKIFDLDWRPDGVLRPGLRPGDMQDLGRLARLSQDAVAAAALPVLEGSNAWALKGERTASGRPLLAGDPHIQFSTPAVWWEAHLKAPGFEIYGHFTALNPMALLGHNGQFGWSITMFQNDDMDLIAETVNPANANEVKLRGQWVAMSSREELIEVKDRAEPIKLRLRRSPHGPVVNDALTGSTATQPIAMWWALLETENPLIEAFYELNRADTLDKGRAAAQKVHAPGLNIVWANAAGDIAWWAAARLPRRPAGVNGAFILDGAAAEAEKPGFAPFAENPQEENPARGYVISANHQPASPTPVPGYYNLWHRAERIDGLLRDPSIKWSSANSRAVQLDAQTGYSQRVLRPIQDDLRQAANGESERALVDLLLSWNGVYGLDQRGPVLYQQLQYEIARAALADEMGEAGWDSLRRTRALDHALPRLMADAASPWWDQRATADKKETRADIVRQAWAATLAHLRATYGDDPAGWTWGRAHTLTHGHPLGRQAPLDKLFNVGPFPAPGGHEMPNNLAARLGPAPWPVVYGPSTRRIIDFAAPAKSLGINPVGQSGVLGDPHYADQARMHVQGQYRQQWLDEADVAAHAKGRLELRP